MEDESDEERCMRIVRSVLDEETALEMVKTYLQFTEVRQRQAWGAAGLQHLCYRKMLFQTLPRQIIISVSLIRIQVSSGLRVLNITKITK